MTAATAAAALTILIGLGKDGAIRANTDAESLRTVDGVEGEIHSAAATLVADETIELKAIVDAYNKVAGKKVKGFKTREEAADALFTALGEVAAKMAARETEGNGSVEGDIEKALKDKKPKKEKKERAEGAGTRGSPLSGKTWSVGANAISGRRMESSGIGVQALKWALGQKLFTTEQYIKDSGAGRFNDLQYDIDKGNIVELTGTPEEMAAEADRRHAARVGAEKAKAEADAAEAKAKAEKKAAAEKAKAEKAEKAAAAKAAKEAEAKAAAEKAAAEGEQAEGQTA